MLAVCRAHEKICTPRTRVRGVFFLFELVNKLVDQRLLLRLERRPALKKLVLLIRQLHKIPIRKKLRQRNAEGFAAVIFPRYTPPEKSYF